MDLGSVAFVDRIGYRASMILAHALSAAGLILLAFLPDVTKDPFVGLLLSVGIMWPGTFSRAAAVLPRGETALFAMMALAGDLGCSGGPTVVGIVSERFGDHLQFGILAAVIFPILLICGIMLCKKYAAKTTAE